MRRAFARCSASLIRPSATIATTARISRVTPSRWNTLRSSVLATTQASRPLHQTARPRDQAVQEKDGSDIYESSKITRFEELETNGVLSPHIVRNLTQGMGMDAMTDVQSATITEALSGKDIIAQAKTGTGKTLAFLLPILQNILTLDPHLAKPQFGRKGPRTTADDIRGLIISPTRELAEQIAMEAKRVTKGTGIVVQTAVGGTQKSAGLRAIQRDGCHLLVGTPGRLKDILSDPYSRVEAPDLSAFVLDEADRLLDQGFWPEIQDIMKLLPTPAEKDRQTLMFSATVPYEVVDIVRDTLKPGFKFVKTVRDGEDPTHARVPQKVVTVKGFENKLPALIELAQRSIKASEEGDGRPFKAIVYFNSTAEVAMYATALKGFGFHDNPLGNTRVMDIHAKLSQAQRTRAAENFRRCTSGILLSSDVTARGMDFPNVTHVIQMAVPTNRDQYIHRIGRTARAGKEGEGWLLLNDLEEREARHRLYKLNLTPDTSLETAVVDMSEEAQVSASTGAILGAVQKAMATVPGIEKANVYRALIGVYGWMTQKAALIRAMNNLSQFGWGMKEAPALNGGLVKKLGFSRVPGVNIQGPGDFEQLRGERSVFGDRGERGGFAPRRDRSSFGGRSGGGRTFGDKFGGDRSSFRGRRDDDNGRGGFGGRDRGGRSEYGDRRRGADRAANF